MFSKARQEKVKKIKEPLLLNEDNEVTDENRDKREIDLDLSIKQSELIETVAADINAQNSMIVDGG